MNIDRDDNSWLGHVSACALFMILFALANAVLIAIYSDMPDYQKWYTAADPVVQTIIRLGHSAYVIPGGVFVVMLFWLAVFRPTKSNIMHALCFVILAAALCFCVIVGYRHYFSANIPAFFEPRYGPKTGLLFACLAGLTQEAIFRMLLLPLLLLLFLPWMRAGKAMFFAAMILGATLVGVHDFLFATTAFSWEIALIRFFIPGMLMSYLFYLNPTFSVTFQSIMPVAIHYASFITLSNA